MLTIYKASAGSGKTFTLAYEYIKSVLGIKLQGSGRYVLNSDRYSPTGHRMTRKHRAILAITFTNAATEEMKTRIVRELARLARPDADPGLYGRWLTEAFGCTPEELRQAASKALAEMLYDYSYFNVSTIDSFFQGVLRTFSREVDHQGDYELQLDTELTMKMCVAEMLDRLNYMGPDTPRRLVEWIQSFSMDNIRQGKGYNTFSTDGEILRNLTRAMARALDEKYTEYSASLRRYMAEPGRLDSFSAQLDSKAREALRPAEEAARAFFGLLKASPVPEEVFNTYVFGTMRALTRGWKYEIKATATDIASGKKAPEKLIVETRRKATGIPLAALEPYYTLMADFCRGIVAGAPRAMMYRELQASLGKLDFFAMATARLEEYLREKNTVLISDTGELLKRIISDAEMPFIYERLGMKLDTLLIDEFQDTSHLQWHNLRPLVANSIAEGHDSLIIGDEKQAIYRFRNSDSELLGHIVQTRDFPRDHTTRGFDPADNTNHRSAGLLVRLNNTLFSRIAASASVESYGNVVQTPGSGLADQPAYISIKFSEAPARAAGARAEYCERVMADMAADILRQHDEGGYRWRDILILTRERREAAMVVDYLSREYPAIRVLSSEALLLSSSPAVRAVMSMLQLVEGSYSERYNSADRKVTYASNADIVMMITRFNYYCAQGTDVDEAIAMALDSSLGPQSIEAEIKAIRAENPANLVALVDAIIHHKLSPAQRLSEQAYITALQDLAIAHTESPDPSIAAFLKAWQANIDKWAIKASADIDAVEVMTVHKSKGLERDCVHIPFADWDLNHREQSLWLPLDALEGFEPGTVPPAVRVSVTANSALRDASVSPFAAIFDTNDRLELIDNLNTCYVAFTRAARELCVHSTVTAMGRLIHEAVTAGADGADNPCLCDTAACYDRLSDSLTMGEPTQRDPGKEGAPKAAIAAQPYTVIFNDKTRRLTSIDDILATDLDIGGEDPKETTDIPEGANVLMQAAAERGNIMHAILASTRTLDQMHASALRQGRRACLDDEETEAYYAELVEAVEAGGDTVAAWFSPGCKVYAERAIFDAASEATFRPDRVVVYPDGSTAVVDYKFTSEARPSHFRQMENYLRLLGELGHGELCGYLWYPLLKKIKKVGPG